MLCVALFSSCAANTSSSPASFHTTDTAPSVSGHEYQVVIGTSGYTPEMLTVAVGDTVVWLNQDEDRRSIVSLYHFQDEDDVSHLFFGDVWVSGDIEPGGTYSRHFDHAGVFEYTSLPLTVRLPMDQYCDFARAGVAFIIVE